MARWIVLALVLAGAAGAAFAAERAALREKPAADGGSDPRRAAPARGAIVGKDGKAICTEDCGRAGVTPVPRVVNPATPARR